MQAVLVHEAVRWGLRPSGCEPAAGPSHSPGAPSPAPSGLGTELSLSLVFWMFFLKSSSSSPGELGPAAWGWGASWQGAGLQDGAVWPWVTGPGSWVSSPPNQMGLLSRRGAGGSCTLCLCTLGAPSVQGTWPSWPAFLPETEGDALERGR